MSAGTSCKVKSTPLIDVIINIPVTFTPKINEDISESVTLLSETGSFSLPLICHTKKCAIKVNPVVVNFGKVALGDSKTVAVKISNEGAIPTNITIEPEKHDQLTIEYESFVAGYTSTC
jgi:hypothetical protein